MRILHIYSNSMPVYFIFLNLCSIFRFVTGSYSCLIFKCTFASICFRGLKEDELQQHIDKLHEYNEVKDVAQMILGRLGNLFQCDTCCNIDTQIR